MSNMTHRLRERAACERLLDGQAWQALHDAFGRRFIAEIRPSMTTPGSWIFGLWCSSDVWRSTSCWPHDFATVHIGLGKLLNSHGLTISELEWTAVGLDGMALLPAGAFE